MATKHNFLSLKDKQNVFVESDNQYNNLNLNQNDQRSVDDTVCLKPFTTDSRKGQNNDFSHLNESKKQSNSWNKCNKHLSATFLNLNRNSEEMNEFKGAAKSANNSTLSLHIAAYENAIEATNESGDCEKERAQNLNLVKKWGILKHIVDSPTSIIDNPFEFPRQQENQAPRPELMQYSASQRLLNPNQMDANIQIELQPDSKVTKKIIKEGAGTETPANGDKVYLHYTGTLENGDVFDSSRERNEAFSFTLGRGQVIKGWDLCVAGMKKGERCQLTLAPEFAYGEAGSPPKIPSNSTLIFDMELLKWEGEDISPDHDGSITKSIIVSGEQYNCPSENAPVTVHAVGSHNGRVFYDQELTYLLGEGSEYELPEGVDRAIRRINKGEKCRVTLKGSRFTFGKDAPAAFNLPQNADLVYTIFLKTFDKVKQSWELTDEEKVQEAEKIRLRGNDFLKQGKLKLALNKYLSVVNLLEYSTPMDEKHKEDFDKQLISGRLNSALVHLKLRETAECIKQIEKVIEKEPKNVKALYRLAQAFETRKDYDDAIREYKKILDIEPDNKAAQQQILVCNAQIAELRALEKKRYHNLFAKLSKDDKAEVNGEHSASTSNGSASETTTTTT